MYTAAQQGAGPPHPHPRAPQGTSQRGARPAELTCTVSMTMEKEWSWQSRASRYWQTPLKVKYLSSKLLKWDCPVTRHSPAEAQREDRRGVGLEWQRGSLDQQGTLSPRRLRLSSPHQGDSKSGPIPQTISSFSATSHFYGEGDQRDVTKLHSVSGSAGTRTCKSWLSVYHGSPAFPTATHSGLGPGPWS